MNEFLEFLMVAVVVPVIAWAHWASERVASGYTKLKDLAARARKGAAQRRAAEVSQQMDLRHKALLAGGLVRRLFGWKR